MLVPSVFTLSKLDDNDFYDYMRQVIERRQEANVRNKVHAYCSAFAIPSAEMTRQFLKPPICSEVCLAITKKTRKKCMRQSLTGSNFCGYHRREHVVNHPRPPRRPPPPCAV